MARSCRLAALLCLLLLGAREAHAAAIALDGEGGDAWTFRKQVTGTVETGPCDAVLVNSPTGTVQAARQGAHFSAAAMLAEGANDVRALCIEQGEERAVSPPQHWTERLQDVPRSATRIEITDTAVILDGGVSTPAQGRAAAITDYAWSAGRDNPAMLRATDGSALASAPRHGLRLALQRPTIDGEYQVSLLVHDALGRSDRSIAAFRVAGGAIRLVDLDRDHPAWIDDAIVYGAVPSLFGPRGLDDVTARLDDIAALGATVLWLSPITNSPPGDFGYAVTDHFHLRSALGSEADLHRLIREAHARGIRVILDVAINHLSDRHPYFRSAAARGAASPYHPFFMWDGVRPVHYFDWTNLETLDFDNPEVRQYAVAAFTRWLRDFDVDGFRVDASWAIKQRAPDFWPSWRRELKRIKPDLLLIAEAPARDPYYGANGFDAAYDWSAKLGEWAWHDAFGTIDVAERLRRVLAMEGSGNRTALTFRFLDNNDTGARFITRFGAPTMRVAAAMLLTLPGIPCLYMGEELGVAFQPYGRHAPIEWTGREDLRDYFAYLAALRHREPALRSRRMALVPTDRAGQLLAYRRPGATPEETLLVLLNYGADAAAVSVENAGIADGRFVDLLDNETVTVTAARRTIAMPAFSARVLRRLPAE